MVIVLAGAPGPLAKQVTRGSAPVEREARGGSLPDPVGRGGLLSALVDSGGSLSDRAGLGGSLPEPAARFPFFDQPIRVGGALPLASGSSAARSRTARGGPGHPARVRRRP
ncbi:hypothetical protein OG738_24060 [Amycolatopsis sp. NBC_01488]|uniref:hypothetical protein n=1 Tax=Amycolatopsis sp. NBC_01488 TaxID=2903563 RepID=UPI002E2B6F33|nr:hypothetical protein [Amycolatopsis sp. NBC_01488]